MEKLNIGGKPIGAGEPPYIVAEIGANHNGDMKLCQRLIEAAKDSGADAVKFQSWSKESLISRAEYARNTRYVSDDKKAPSLEEAVEQYQLTPRQHRDVAAYCHELRIDFFSSCFSPDEVDFFFFKQKTAYEIASMDVNHLPLLEYVAKTAKPIILST